MNRHELEALYTLNNPATSQAIKMLPPEWHILYPSYLQFLELSNGLFGDEITLLEAEDIQQRNIDYEVKEYLPNFLMIGDNGGGVAILMDNKNQNIFAVGMGVMSEDAFSKNAKTNLPGRVPTPNAPTLSGTERDYFRSTSTKAAIPISAPTKVATNRWRKSSTTTKTKGNTSSISITTKSASRGR